ncbi:MAG: ABC transporter substrate-binding protein [Clostridiales bacterium]|nr:MAG: ABC transporter substrate-binding protein [Clostridiales bacterium]
MIKMKKFLALILSGIMMLSVAACSSGQTAENENTAGELQDFDIVLDWYPNAVHSFIYVAMEKGYYEEEGLNVNVQFPSNTNDAISLTAAGQADAGLYYQTNTVSTAANQNIPIKVIGTVVQHPLNIVMSMGESGINGAKDLKGKTVGYPGTPDNEVFIKAMMEHNGLKYEDVTMQDVGFDLNTALITGNVDAIIGGYINHEYPTLLQEGYDVTYFDITDEGIPDYEELVLVTGEKQIEEESDKLEAFIRASKKGFEDMKKDPQAALDTLLKYQDEGNYPLDPEIEKASMEILLPLMESDEQEFLTVNEQSWTDTIDWLNEQGLLENEISASDILALQGE